MIFAAAIPIAEALAPYVVPAATGAVAALVAWVGLSDQKGCEVPRLPTDLFSPPRQPVPVPIPDRSRYTAHLLASATAVTAQQFQRFLDDGVESLSGRLPLSSPNPHPQGPTPFLLGAGALISGLSVWALTDSGDDTTPPKEAAGASTDSPEIESNAGVEAYYDAIHQACSAHIPGIALKKMVRFVKRNNEHGIPKDDLRIPKDDLPSQTIWGAFFVFQKGAETLLSAAVQYLKTLRGVCQDPSRLTELDCANLINLAGTIHQIEQGGSSDALLMRASTLIALAQLESVVTTAQGSQITMNLKGIQSKVHHVELKETIRQLKNALGQYLRNACGESR